MRSAYSPQCERVSNTVLTTPLRLLNFFCQRSLFPASPSRQLRPCLVFSTIPKKADFKLLKIVGFVLLSLVILDTAQAEKSEDKANSRVSFALTLDLDAQDATVECDEDSEDAFDEWVDNNGGAIISGACGTVNWDWELVDQGDVSFCGNTEIFIVTFTATDDCDGASVSTTATFTIQDTTPPTPPAAPADLTLDCTDNIPAPPTLLAYDECDGVDINGVFSETDNGGSGCVIITRTWTFTDDCNNTSSTSQTITVIDNTAPIIFPQAQDQTIECDENSEDAFDEWIDNNGGAVAIDNCGNVNWDWELVDQGDVSFCGNTETFIVTFTASDDCGNEVSTTATFTIQDTTPPTPPAPPANVTVACIDDVAMPVDLLAPDECSDEDILGVVSETNNGGAGCVGDPLIITRTWTFTDDCNNTSSTSQTITVIDNTAPIIFPQAQDQTIECDENSEDAFDEWIDNNGGAVAIDNCGNINWDWELVDQGDVSFCGNTETFIVIFTASDDCGNSASTTATFTIQDTTPPTPPAPPANVTLACIDDVAMPADLFAPDECSDEDILGVVSETNNGGTGCAGDPLIITRTWTFTDECGNASTSSQTITIIDDVNPVITAPADITIACNESDLPTNTGQASATDNCDDDVAVTYADTVTPGVCDNESNITRTWTATDDCGNTATAVQIISIIDNTAPVLLAPAQDITVECDEDSEDAFDNWIDLNGLAAATDLCGPVTWTFDITDPGDVEFCGNTQVLEVTFTATDACNNAISTTATFTIQDTTPPTPPAPPANVTLACIDDVAMPADLFAPDECSDDDILGVVSETNNGGAGCAGDPLIITRTWTFTDECGNASTSSQTITIIDDVNPVITAPANITIACNESDLPTNTGQASATDNCDDDVAVTYADTVTPGVCDNESNITRTWTATDDCGNTATAVQIISIIDNTAPVLLAPAQDITVECDEDSEDAFDNWIDLNGLAAATDLCGPVTWTFDITDPGDVEFCGNTQVLEVTFTATDACNNAISTTATFTIQDTTPPTPPAPPANVTLACIDDVAMPADLFAPDECSDEDILGVVSETNNGGTGCAGDPLIITRTWTFTDECGNASTSSQTITIIDDVNPVITAPADITIACNESDLPTNTGQASATDNCDDDVAVTYADTVTPGVCDNESNITRTWTATDDCGNTATAVQIISIIDNTAPVLLAPAQDITVECDEDSEDAFDNWIDLNGLAAATDLCGPVTWTFDITDPGDVEFCGNTQVLEVTFTATDACNNAISTTATFTIQDTTPPTPPAPPANVTLACIDDVAMPADLFAPDECSDEDILGVVSETNNGGAGCAGDPLIITRTWTFTDECGNASTSSQTITVIDDVNPVITAPADITIACNESDLPTNTGQASATDNCDDDVAVTYADTITPGVCDNESNITRTWTATDDCGNTATAVQIISIIDNTAPVLLAPAQDITVECDEDSEDAFDNWIDLNGLAAATDLCGPVTWTFDITDPGDVEFCGNTQVLEVTFTATDACNNAISTTATFTIQDTTPPTPPAPPANVTLACIDDVAMPADLFAPDECSDEDILGVVSETNNGGTGCAGDPLIITRTWTFTDECGNASTSSQTITIIDDVNPVITAPADITIACNESDLPTNTGQASATDNCDDDVAVTYADTVTPGVCDNESNITRTWTATDDCGNTATAVQIISIIDNTAPVLLAPAQDITVECDEDSEDAFDNWIDLNGLAAATDLCGPVTWTFDITDPGDVEFCGNTQVLEVTFTATDACNNAISTTATFTIQDTTPPTPPAPPANVTLACIDDVAMPADLFAPDECSDDDILGVVSETNNGGAGCAGDPLIITRTWTFTDECGNASTSSQTITIIDDVNPVITAPANITIACNESDLPTNTGQASATDNCDDDVAVTYADTVTPGVCDNESNITRTWTATDDCGNTATAVQIISIIDNTAPVLLAPAQDITVECDEDSEDAFDNWIDLNGLAAATDLCGPVTWTFDITDPGDVEFCGNTQVLEVTFTATDACNNAISTTATFTIQDTTPPTPPAPPANVTLACIDDVAMPADLFAPDECSDDDILGVVSETNNGGAGCAGDPLIITRTWTFTDECGNASTSSQTITIIDDVNPVITAPANITIACNESDLPTNTGQASATDNCDDDVAVTYADTVTPGVCDNESNITRTWTATDDCGNTATAVQIISIIDNTAPVLLAPAQDITVECDEDSEDAFDNWIDLNGLAAATDLCGPVTWTFDITDPGDVEFCGNTQVLEVTFTATDACNNAISTTATFTIQDTTPPTPPAPPANVTLACIDDVAMPADLFAPDECSDDDILGVVSETNNGGTGCAGDPLIITRTWTFTDECGNASTSTQTITIIDDVNPVITAPADITIACNESDLPTNTGQASATDNCDDDVAVTYADTVTPGVCDNESNITRTWTATDDCGNTATAVQIISIIDNTAPVLLAPAQDITVECDEDSEDAFDNWIDLNGLAAATDLCGPVTWTFDITDPGDVEFCGNTQVLEVTFTATDACNNAISTTATFTIQDTTPPTPPAPPANVTLACIDDVAMPADLFAPDECSDDDILGVVSETNNGGTGCAGDPLIITRTWTFTDECGNASTSTQTITIIDDVNPVITAPADITIACNESDLPTNTGQASATDNCDDDVAVTYADTVTPGVCDNESNITRTWTATDDCGNTATAVQIISIIDNTAPVLLAPAQDITVECDEDSEDAFDNWIDLNGLAAATDLCGPVTWTFDITDPGDVEFCGNTQVLEVTFTATDACNNAISTTATFTIQDTTPPTPPAPPANVTLACIDDVAMPADLFAPDECSDDDILGVVSETNNGGTGCAGDPLIITRTWTFTDECGNASTSSQTITVIDDVNPVITAPADITIACNESDLPTNTGQASATDNCDDDVAVTYADTITPGVCDNESNITRTWTATDDCGNTATAVQIISIIDNTAPVLLAPAQDITVECDEDSEDAFDNWIDLNGLAAATDLCGPVTWTFDITDPGDVEFCGNTQVLEVTFTATDACNNAISTTATFTIQDTTPPTPPAPPANVTLACIDDVAMPADLFAPDECSDEDILGVVSETNNGGAGCAGDPLIITRTWTFTDECGNASTSSQTITVIDDVNPVITAPADITIACNESDLPTNTGQASATDNCDDDVAVTYADTITPGVCDNESNITRTWTATDDCGNTATAVQIISIIDNTAPVLLAPAQDITVECDEDSEDAFDNWIDLNGLAAATDLCGPVTWTFDITDPGDVEFCGNTQVLEVTFTATDACNNAISTTATFTIQDTTPPTPPAPPANVTLACIDDVAMPADLFAPDECSDEDILGVVSETNNGGTGCAGDPLIITRTWTFTDECGNASTSSQTITIIDDVNPVITAPADITIACNESDLPTNTGQASATDNCDDDVAVTYADTVTPGVCDNESNITRTWTATDDCGNTATAVQIISIIDNTAPVLLAPAQDITVECDEDSEDAFDNWIDLNGLAAATDLCGPVTWTFDITDPGDVEFCGNTQVLEVTFTATDACNNAISTTATFTIQDTTPPTPPAPPANVTLACIDDVAMPADLFAPDECSDEDILGVVSETNNGGAGCAGDPLIITRTWTFTDECGNASTSSQTITVIDDVNPVITAPADITIACNESDLPTNTGQASATDNCDDDVAVTYADTITPGVCDNESNITRTWTATDDCGNTATAVQIISIIDNTAPVLLAPAQDITVECDEDSEDAFDNWIDLNGLAAATDLCGPVTWTFDITDPGDVEFCGNTQVLEVTFTATDACNNAISTTATFTIQDTTPPTPPAPPANVTLACIDDVAMPADLFAPDECSDEDILGVVSETNNGGTGCAGDPLIITRTWTFTDECGNASTSSQTITIIDDVNPVITAPADITIACNESDLPTNTGQASATDNCDDDVAVTYADTVTPGVCDNESNITRTWTATDDCGNTATAVQIISIIDNTAPVLLAPAQDITVECDEDSEDAFDNWIDLNGLAAATDLCGPVTWTFDITDPGDVEFCGNTQVLEVTFTATDACNNAISTTATFTIQDTTPPTPPAPPANVTLACIDDVAMPADLFAPDECSDEDILGVVSETNNGGTGCAGDPLIITRTWTFTDECGNASTSTQTITIIDDVAPTVDPVGDVFVDCSENVPAVDLSIVSAIDNCTTVLTVTHVGDVSDGNESPETITRTYRVADDCGNFTDVIQTIVVNDTEDPTITCPADISINNDPGICGAVVTYPEPVGSDNCVGVTTTQTAGLPSGSTFPVGTTTNTFVVTDAAGNTATCSFEVTVSDNEAPTIACAADVNVNNDPGVCGAVVTYSDPATSDNCPGQTWVQTAGLSSGSTFPVGTTTNTFVVTDAAGNTATCSFDVTVTDNEAPTIACAADVSVNNDPGVCGAVVTYDDPMTTDNCPGQTWVQTAGLSSGSTFPVGTTTNTFVVTDAAGNTATCSFDVIVTDNEAPTIACAADVSVNNDPGVCGAVVTYDDPMTTDNCPGQTWVQTAGLSSGSTFPVGTTTNTFVVTDAAGNTATCSFEVTVSDNEAPTIACAADVNVNNDPGVCGAVVTYDDPATSDNCPGQTWVQTAGLSSGSTFPVGTTTNTFVVTDAAGNTATCSFDVTVTDNEAPTIACAADVNINNDPGVCGAVVTYDDPATSDNCPGETWVQTAGLSSGSTFPVGTTTNTFVITDAAGNTATCSFDVTVTDNEAPTIACAADVSVNNDPGVCGAVVTYDDPMTTDNCPGQTWVQTAGLSSGSTFPVGTTTNTFVVTDAAGNTATCSFDVTVSDNEAPTIACAADVNVNNDPGVCGAIVTYDDPATSDNCPGETWVQTAGLSSGSTFPVGTTTNTFVVTDAAGNTASCSFEVTVTDNEAPTIACAADVNVNNDPGVCGAVVTYSDPATSDNCPGETWVQTAGLSSGSTFPVGTTTNTFVVTDAAGNTASCSFEVTVSDNEAPTIACAADVNINNDPGVCGAVVTYDDPATSDNCPGETWVQTAGLSSGSTFPVGTTTNTFVITDAAGNTATCSFDVTVTDNEAPTIACAADVSVNNDPGVCGAVVTYDDPAPSTCH